jgi:catechol 2,3-dioxygenase-like lactoylglutathione lyase family enzyme
MQFHQGRLLDHVHVRVADLEASKRFYRAVLAAVGRELTREGEHAFSADELYVTADRTPTAGLHMAFQAGDREAVERFHQAGLAAGGTDNGAPGERPYHPGYYGAYLLDPERGNALVIPSSGSLRSVSL